MGAPCPRPAEGRGWGGGQRDLSRSAHRRVREGSFQGHGSLPERGWGSSRDAPALAASAHRRARVLPLPPFARDRIGPGAAARLSARGAPASPRGRPAAGLPRGLFIAPGHHVGGVAVTSGRPCW